MEASKNPYANCIKELSVDGVKYKYFSLADLNDPRINRLPYSIRVLLE
jgi:aconitase A